MGVRRARGGAGRGGVDGGILICLNRAARKRRWAGGPVCSGTKSVSILACAWADWWLAGPGHDNISGCLDPWRWSRVRTRSHRGAEFTGFHQTFRRTWHVRAKVVYSTNNVAPATMSEQRTGT